MGTKLDRDAMLPYVQAAAAGTGRATSALRVLPGLLICGAQRCGTTSMYQALRQHPAVLRPVARKGVHYFDDTAYLRGLSWYRAHFPMRSTASRVARRAGEPALVFESSPYYLFHPAAAARIARDLPEVRVLTLLRDPVERAYSAWAHESARGYESETFERALDLENERIAGEAEKLLADPAYASHGHRHQAYVSRGHYIDQVERFLAELGPDRVLVVDAEDFFTDPEPVWDAVAAFTGLSTTVRPTFRRHNARPRSAMPDAVRERLARRFEDSDAKLEAWWGRPPSWRR